jgi:hypothetical protein
MEYNTDRDAAHIALATAHEMDFLLSWNCRHIANAALQTPLRRLAESAGLNLPVICTPGANEAWTWARSPRNFVVSERRREVPPGR